MIVARTTMAKKKTVILARLASKPRMIILAPRICPTILRTRNILSRRRIRITRRDWLPRKNMPRKVGIHDRKSIIPKKLKM
jgi:hypothetical protein